MVQILIGLLPIKNSCFIYRVDIDQMSNRTFCRQYCIHRNTVVVNVECSLETCDYSGRDVDATSIYLPAMFLVVYAFNHHYWESMGRYDEKSMRTEHRVIDTNIVRGAVGDFVQPGHSGRGIYTKPHISRKI